jgi:hypothetical protein
MLLIWDVHINVRVRDRILEWLRGYINQFPDEESVVFMWDYVYHFAYDRTSLLALFDFFIELCEAGKIVYVLAGNHDWLAENFVFAEAKKAFSLLGKDATASIHFITKPEVFSIEGQHVMFVPYVLESEEIDNFRIWNDLFADDQYSDVQKILQDLTVLAESNNERERISAYLIRCIIQAYLQYDDLLVIHHCYMHDTVFPGQNSRFNYKDVALHPWLLDLVGLRLVSWHMHTVFSYKNYLCLGSIWYTSSLEYDQLKFVACYKEGVVYLHPILLNPYLSITLSESQIVNNDDLCRRWEDVWQDSISCFKSEVWHLDIPEIVYPVWKQVSLLVYDDVVNYDSLRDKFANDVLHSVATVTIKKNTKQIWDLLAGLEAKTRDLHSGFADWKSIIREYLERKYPNNYQEYIQVLQALQIL